MNVSAVTEIVTLVCKFSCLWDYCWYAVDRSICICGEYAHSMSWR